MAQFSRESVSVDEDNKFAFKAINDNYIRDMPVHEFFTTFSIASSSTPRFLETREQIATLSDTIQYPAVVLSAVASSKRRVFMGSLPSLSYLYCIVDNRLFIWAASSNTNVKTFTAKGNEITCVAYGKPESKVFNRNVTHVILVATDRTISIIPCNDLTLYSDKASTKFVQFCTVSAQVLKCGDIYVGAADGDVYKVTYKTHKGGSEIPSLDVTNVTTNALMRYTVNLLFPLRSPIKQIAIKEDKGLAAVLRTNNKIHFYKMEDGEFKYLSCEDPVTDIQAIHPIPLSDSGVLSFVSFTKTGLRIFYSTVPGFSNLEEIHAVNFYAPDESFAGRELIASSFSHGTSVFLFKDMVAVTKPNMLIHSSINPTTESIFRASFESGVDALNFARGGHILEESNTSYFKHEMMCQHIGSAAPGFISCSNGYRIININYPVDSLQKIIKDCNGSFAKPVRDWMLMNDIESYPTALLLASKSPEMRKTAMMIFYQFSRLNSQKKTQDMRVSYQVCGFYMRAERLLALLWNMPLFELRFGTTHPNEKKFKINKIFEELPQNLIDNVRLIITLGDDYLRIRRSTADPKDNEQRKEIDREAISLYKLDTFLSSLIETLKFMQILKEHKSIISATMDKIAQQHRTNLTEFSFDTIDDPNKIFESLREFAATLFIMDDGPRRGDHFALKLGRECPSFFSEAASLINEALSELAESKANPQILQKTSEVFQKYADQISNDKLKDICNLYNKFQYYKGAVAVVLQRAEALDPTHIALVWYKGGKQENDERGIAYFKKRFECYEPLFKLSEIDEALDIMIQSKDEMFHIFLYDYMLSEETNRVNKFSKDNLLSRETEYIVSYLEEYNPELLYLYSAKHNDFATAAIRLFDYATSNKNDITINDRIAYFRNVITYSRGSGINALLTTAKNYLINAQIQQELDSENNKLMTQEELYENCINSERWDLVLRLFATSKLDAENVSQVISEAWTRLLERKQDLSLADLANVIIKTTKDIPGESEVLNSEILIPILEDHRIKRAGATLWAINTLVRCGINKNKAIDFYFKALDNKSMLEPSKTSYRADFIYCILWLADNGGDLRGRSMNEFRDWFIQNARFHPDYDKVYILFNKLL